VPQDGIQWRDVVSSDEHFPEKFKSENFPVSTVINVVIFPSPA
jgi:hypothetical protein